MNAVALIPKFRVEIRDAGNPDEKTNPWFTVDLADTEHQAAARAKRANDAAMINPVEIRIVPNTPTQAAIVIEAKTDPQFLALEKFRDNIIALTGTAKIEILAEAMHHHQEATTIETELRAEIEKLKGTPVDAMAGVSPSPWAVGDELRDVHTGVHVYVTENLPNGFNWVEKDNSESKGFVPIGSCGCFVPVEEQKVSAKTEVKEIAPFKADPIEQEIAPAKTEAKEIVPAVAVPVAKVAAHAKSKPKEKAPAKTEPKKKAHPPAKPQVKKTVGARPPSKK